MRWVGYRAALPPYCERAAMLLLFAGSRSALGVLPCAPPVPAAPAGGSGEAQGQSGGLRPPTPYMAWAPPGCMGGSAYRCQPGGLPL